METNHKALEGPESTPLLPVSCNPKSNYSVPSVKSHYISKVTIFRRIVLMVKFGTFLSLIYYFSSMSLVPKAPDFQLDSLFISNFNISNTTFQVDWDMSLKIENPNLVSTVHFNSIRGSISYKGNPLAMYSEEPFELGYMEHRLLHMKLSKHRTVATNELVSHEINRQLDDNGAVNFSLTMFVSGTYTTGGWRTEKFVLNAQCLELKVVFLPNTRFGSWVNGGPKKCSLPML